MDLETIFYILAIITMSLWLVICAVGAIFIWRLRRKMGRYRNVDYWTGKIAGVLKRKGGVEK